MDNVIFQSENLVFSSKVDGEFLKQIRGIRREMLCKKGVLKIKSFSKFTGPTWEQLYLSLFFWKSCKLPACNFMKKETPVQMFSSEFCEISKDTYFVENLRTAVSGLFFIVMYVLLWFSKKLTSNFEPLALKLNM